MSGLRQSLPSQRLGLGRDLASVVDGYLGALERLLSALVQVVGIQAQFFEDVIDAGFAFFRLVTNEGHRADRITASALCEVPKCAA